MNEILIVIIAFMSMFVAAPAIIFSLLFLIRKEKNKVEIKRHEKEILELEIKKEELQIKRIAEENKKYDRIIEHKLDPEEKTRN